MSNEVKDEISLQVRKMMTTTNLDSNPRTSGEGMAQISREPQIDHKEARANEIDGQMKKFRENRSSDLRKKSIAKIDKDPFANTRQGLLNETTNTAGKATKKLSRAQILHRIAWGVGVFLGLGAIVGLLMTGLLIFQNHLFYGSVSYTTTTKTSGLTTLNVGQLCQWNNQCPTNAYCLGTCQCSDTTYFDSSSGACVTAGTIGSGCTYDYHCNRVQRLTCVGGFCSCENVNLIWNNAYSGGGGIISGRCQLRSGEGKTANLCFSNYDTSGVTYGSASSICTCDLTYGLNFDESNYDCTYTLPYSRCVNSYECGPMYTACMNIDGDNYTKCTPLPTAFYRGGYGFKSTYGGNCNLYQPCNEFQNLKCSDYLYGNGTVYGTCVCYSKYYYWNGTMCILGNRYGENCTTLSTCVPLSANMTCLVPYSGASYTVCRCPTSGYYHLGREYCYSLKGYKSTCRDSTECYDGYQRSVTLSYGFCGVVPGGSWPVCLCINGYFAWWNGWGCGLNTGSCNYANNYGIGQCPNNQYCTSGDTCTCINEKYLSSGVCYWLKYQGDPCTSGTECWSGSCASSACT